MTSVAPFSLMTSTPWIQANSNDHGAISDLDWELFIFSEILRAVVDGTSFGWQWAASGFEDGDLEDYWD